MICHISLIKGQLMQLSKNKQAKQLLRRAPHYVKKWQQILNSFPKADDQEVEFYDEGKPSMEIDLDLYDDEVVETIDNEMQLHAKYKDMQDLKDMEKDLAEMYQEQDDYFGTKDHQNTIEFFNDINDDNRDGGVKNNLQKENNEAESEKQE